MSGFGEEFGDRLEVVQLDATLPASKPAIEALGFGNHGLVIRSEAGEVLFKQADHEVDVEQVHSELAARLEPSDG